MLRKKKRMETKPAASVSRKPGFPIGSNVISDPDIRKITDLPRHYPLPEGFDYVPDREGVPYNVRESDGW